MGNKIMYLASCLIFSDQHSYIHVDGNVLSRVSNSSSSQAHLKMAGAHSFSMKGNRFNSWNLPSNDTIFVWLVQWNCNNTISLSSNHFSVIKAGQALNLDFLSSATPTMIAIVFEQTMGVLDLVFHIWNWQKSCRRAQCTLVGKIFNSSLPLGQHHLIFSESLHSVESFDISIILGEQW